MDLCYSAAFACVANLAATCLRSVQERPEEVPTGELPQNMTLIVDRHLVSKISPGTRVTVIGIYSIYQVLCWLQAVLPA